MNFVSESESLVIALEVLLTRFLTSLKVGIHIQKGVTKKTKLKRTENPDSCPEKIFSFTRRLHTRRALISLEIRPLDPRSTFERSKFILKMSEP
jgi:hypothetical protein